VLGLPSVAQAGTSYRVVYLDEGTTTGFHDPTAAAPVGGNTGKTIGEQRRIAFEAAVGIWANVLSSTVPWTIEAAMAALPCDAESAVLGQANPTTVASLIPPGGSQRLAYPVALANALRGSDLLVGDAEDPNGSEIHAEFNSAVGNANCVGGRSFYLGLDGNAGKSFDFLGIVLHELGHGLGFSSFLDFETGEPLMDGAVDAFSLHVFDLDRNAAWNTLNPAQLLESMKNARRVVWDGADVQKSAPHFLVKGSPRITVTPAVSGLSGKLSEHDQGPKLADHPATGPLVIPNPASGCSKPSNRLNGSIALIDPRDACNALEATAWMQAAGALAVIAVDSSGTWPPTPAVGILEGQTIPLVTIHPTDAALLKAGSATRTVTLDGDPNQMVGADSAGRVLLNATSPVVATSTISHWDSLARNQLLMEPTRSAGHRDVDLTREFMRDLGWPICGDGIVQATENCDDGNVYAEADACDSNCANRTTTGGASNSSSAANTGGGPSSLATGGAPSAGGNASSVAATNHEIGAEVTPPSSSSVARGDSGCGCSLSESRSRWTFASMLWLVGLLHWGRSRRGMRRNSPFDRSRAATRHLMNT
jgi:cysteine-rich repeat protein